MAEFCSFLGDFAMKRKLIFYGALGLAVLSLLPVRILRAGEEEEEEDKSEVRFAIIEVSDENQKISYLVTTVRGADKRMEERRERGKRAREEWKKLSSAERKRTPEPAMVKAKVVKQNIKSEEEAKALAERYLEKVPESKRAGELKKEGEKETKRGEKGKEVGKEKVTKEKTEKGKGKEEKVEKD
jgi:hypothetical protein